MNKNDNEKDPVQLYLDSLSPKELQAYHIAKSHLGCSYQTEKSNAFLKWCKQNNIVYKPKTLVNDDQTKACK